MAEIRSLPRDSSDDALLRRLFELTWSEQQDRHELSRVEALVYARLADTYGEREAPPQSGPCRVAARQGR